MISAVNWLGNVGRECTVVGHSDIGGGYTHEVDVDGLDQILWAKRSQLLPIGHDPDAETRKTEREVEA